MNTPTRRTFLLRTSAWLGLGLGVRSIGRAQSAKSAQPPVVPEFKPLRRGTGYFTARGGTIGWLVNTQAVAAVDTQFPETARLFLEGLPGRSGRKLDVLVNSHHHGDHTGGNGVFQPVTRSIVAHVNVPRLQRERAQRDNTLERQTYADTTFAESWRKDVGDEIVSAKYHGPAHTGGDVVAHFERANVVHMGDLVFNRMYPVIDRPGGARIRGWIGVLEAVAKAYAADTVFIFGHGNPKFGVTGKRDDLLVLRDYLAGLLAHVEKRIQAGEPKERIVALDNLPGFPDFHVAPGPQNRLPLNLGVAFDELTGKEG
ncbi:MAG: MBL fold metallo-hydrolase [Verrucomicrobia bacterium]|nr:MBL fold metallo-hydrolase [Verrucomicrobiota bacterium]